MPSTPGLHHLHVVPCFQAERLRDERREMQQWTYHEVSLFIIPFYGQLEAPSASRCIHSSRLPCLPYLLPKTRATVSNLPIGPDVLRMWNWRRVWALHPAPRAVPQALEIQLMWMSTLKSYRFPLAIPSLQTYSRHLLGETYVHFGSAVQHERAALGHHHKRVC